MSKAKLKQSEPTAAVDTVAPVPSEPAATAPPANTGGWRFEPLASGIEGMVATLLFKRLPSAAVASNRAAARQERDDALQAFKSEPAAVRLVDLSERLAKVDSDLDAAFERHTQAQAAFVADGSAANEAALDAAYASVQRLMAQSDALNGAVDTARAGAETAYQIFQQQRDAGRGERLRAEAAEIAEKIQLAVAPLLEQFNVARNALRQGGGLNWPALRHVLPAADRAPKPTAKAPAQNLSIGAGGLAPVLVDNRMAMPWYDRPRDPNWGRERVPVLPGMQSNPQPEPVEHSETTTN